MEPKTNVAIVVAKPGDETLWLGGLLLLEKSWNVRVLAMSGGEDPDTRERFSTAMEIYGADGWIEDFSLDGQSCSVSNIYMSKILLDRLGDLHIDVLYTHSLFGEFTRSAFREKVGESIGALWNSESISATQLRMFAYTDLGGTVFPRAIHNAHVRKAIPDATWDVKRKILKEAYGFEPESWEARTSPMKEAYWAFHDQPSFMKWYAGQQRFLRPSAPPASPTAAQLTKATRG